MAESRLCFGPFFVLVLLFSPCPWPGAPPFPASSSPSFCFLLQPSVPPLQPPPLQNWCSLDNLQSLNPPPAASQLGWDGTWQPVAAGCSRSTPLAWQPPSPKAQGRVWPWGRGVPPGRDAKGHPHPCTHGAAVLGGTDCPPSPPCCLAGWHRVAGCAQGCPRAPRSPQALLGFGGPQVPACAPGPGSARSAWARRTPHRCSGDTQLGPRVLLAPRCNVTGDAPAALP